MLEIVTVAGSIRGGTQTGQTRSDLAPWGLGLGTIVLQNQIPNPNNLTAHPCPDLPFSCVSFRTVKHQTGV